VAGTLERWPNVTGGTIESDQRLPRVVNVQRTLSGKGVLIAPTGVLPAPHCGPEDDAGTTYRNSFAASVRRTANATHAFDMNGQGAEPLLVDPNRFLQAEGAGEPAQRAGYGTWTVRVDGPVVNAGCNNIRLIAGNPAMSSVTVGNRGNVGRNSPVIGGRGG
jgi:hypothetical protein